MCIRRPASLHLNFKILFGPFLHTTYFVQYSSWPYFYCIRECLNNSPFKSRSAITLDFAITCLHILVRGKSKPCPDYAIIEHILIATDLSFFRPKKFTFKSYKRYYFTFKDTHLSMFRSREETRESPIIRVNLRGLFIKDYAYIVPYYYISRNQNKYIDR